MRRLYELVTDDGSPISPYAWRTRYVLAYKGLPFDPCGVGFTEIANIGPGSFRTVPVLEDRGRWVEDSWSIASYLDEHYPAAPPVFSSPSEYATLRFVEKWLFSEVVTRLFRICVLDIHDRLRPGDRAYFRQTREQRLGGSLEAAHEQRGAQLPLLRTAVQPIRLALREQPFLGGEAANYADFMAMGAFIWAGTVATLPLLEEDDPILSWINRSLRLYGGIGEGLILKGIPPRPIS